MCRNPYRSILVRAVGGAYAIDEALRIIDTYEPAHRPSVGVPPVAGTGHGTTGAPRGPLYHRCRLDADGTVTDARLAPPTAQNPGAVEHDPTDLLRTARTAITGHAGHDIGDEELAYLCERAVRDHDPRISCATRFPDLTVDRT